jgi:hypothetical protein
MKTGLHDRRGATLTDRVAPDTGPMTGSTSNQQPSTIRGEAQTPTKWSHHTGARVVPSSWRATGTTKHAEEIMRILEAFDLTQSFRAAGELAGCDHHTVAHWVARRDAGELTATAVRRPQLIDEYLPKLEEWMEASRGKIRADVAHDKLETMEYTGSERTTRRAVAKVRAAWLAGHRRVHLRRF